MTFVPYQASLCPPQADGVATQLYTVRKLALLGAPGPARQICGSMFLDHAGLLARDEMLLGAYIECLLLLEMTALLPRIVQAIYGVTFEMTLQRTSGRRNWTLSFGNGITLIMPAQDRQADPATRERRVAHWSTMIRVAAERDPVGVAPAVRVLEPTH